MKDRSPCISCKHRYPGCQARCEVGKAYWRQDQERRDRIKAEKAKEGDVDRLKIERVRETKKRAGLV